jgi:hypothetical protein
MSFTKLENRKVGTALACGVITGGGELGRRCESEYNANTVYTCM